MILLIETSFLFKIRTKLIMHTTALKNPYLRIVFLTIILFLSFLTGDTSFTQQNQLAKPVNPKDTVRKENHPPLTGSSTMEGRRENTISRYNKQRPYSSDDS